MAEVRRIASGVKFVFPWLEFTGLTPGGNKIGLNSGRHVNADDELIFTCFFPFDSNDSQRSRNGAAGVIQVTTTRRNLRPTPSRLDLLHAQDLLRQVIKRRCGPRMTSAL